MRKLKLTETQIVNAIKEHESGRKSEDICRELGFFTVFFTNGNSVMAACK